MNFVTIRYIYYETSEFYSLNYLSNNKKKEK